MIYDGTGHFYIDNNEKKSSSDTEIFNHIDAYPFFEVIRVINDTPLFLEEHIKRLRENLDFFHFYNPPEPKALELELYSAIRENSVRDQNVKLAVVDDDYEVRHIFAYPVKSSYPSEDQYEKGCNVMVLPMEREQRVKLYSDLSFEKIWREILRAGVFEALLMNTDGRIREGSRSNVFFLKDDTVVTADDYEIISTVNRSLVLEIIKALGLEIVFKPMSVKDLYFTDGAFMVGSLVGVLPISRIEQITLKSVNNPHILKIRSTYEERIRQYVNER